MKPTLCQWLVLAGLLAGAGRLSAQLTAVEYVQNGATYNLQSQRGVPLSTVVNVPPGSDGLQPPTNSSYGSFNHPTTNQFQGLISFGAIAAPTDWTQLTNAGGLLHGTNPFSYQVAVAMQLPVGRTNGTLDNSIAIVLFRAQVGAPYLSRQVSFAFGSIIPPPNTDENGVLLPTNLVNTSYWQALPISASHGSCRPSTLP